MEAAFELITQPDVEYDPTEWQLEDIAKHQDMPYSADWSEMGCLKTSSCVWFAEARAAKNILVITSKNGKGAYYDTVPKSVEGWKIYNMSLQGMEEYVDSDLQIPVDADEILQTAKLGFHDEPWIILIHYDCFSPRHSKKYNILKRFAKIKWDVIACDEAHKMKNRKTGWVIEIKKLRAMHKRVMTGTGFVNNPAEMWSLLNFLGTPEGQKGYWPFRTRYCEEYIDARGFRVITGLKKSRIGEFRKMRASLGPRHTMDEVHPDIGKPIEAVREVDLNATQRRMYNEIKSVLSTLDQQGEMLSSPNVLSQLNRLRQICVATPSVTDRYFSRTANRQVTEIELVEPSSKLDEVMSILEDISWDDEARRQAVIFSNFKDPLKLLEARFQKIEMPYLHLKVSMNEADRYRMWHDTFPKGNHRVLMSTLALGGESINLTSAQYLIFLDRSWSPKDMMQAIGRVYRPGQKHVPEVIYINARKTVDSYVKERLDKKQGWFNDIFGK